MSRGSLFCCSNNRDHKIIHFCPRRNLYWMLAALRIFLNFVPQTGYIHPDEYFQFIEVASGDAFDIDVYKPWEFNVTFPVRHSLFPQLFVRVPYFFLANLSPYFESYLGVSLKTPYFMILFPRLLMTLLSFVSDYCLYKICLIIKKSYVERLTLFASSYVMLVYSTRTFSNCIEMALTSVLLYYVSRCMEFSNKVVFQKDHLTEKYYKAKTAVERVKIYKILMSLPADSLNNCFLLATVTVFGIFNRPTFVAFALPPIFFWLRRGLGSKTVGFLDFHKRILTFVIFAIPTTVIMIVYDSLYYGYLAIAEIAMLEISINNFVVTPLNFLKYNSMTENLKAHGLHPRYLHFFVNVPLLFNILGILGIITFGRMLNSGLKGRWLDLPRIYSIESLMLAAYIVPVCLLSVFPHQEPRFILPILLPLVLLFTHNIKDIEIDTVDIHKSKTSTSSSGKSKSRINLLHVWYLSNIVLTLFYGFMHQGGMYPLTNHLSKELKSKPDLTQIHYVSSHLYPLPTALLQLRNSKKIFISDSGHRYKITKDFHLHELGSQGVESIINQISIILKECEKNLRLKKIPYRLYYALPFSFYYELSEYTFNNETLHFKFNMLKSFYPHISMEKVPEFDFPWSWFRYKQLDQCLNTIINFFDYTLTLSYLKQFTLVLYRIEPSSTR